MRRRRYSNPGVGRGVVGLGKKALYIITGAVATRSVTQMILGAKNTGAMGYAANAVAAIGLGWAATKFLKNKKLGANVTIGGVVGLVLRMLQDLTPVGKFVPLQLAGLDAGMGAIVPTMYFVPLNSGNDINNTQVPSQLQAKLTPAPAMAGLGRASGRYSGSGRY